MNERTPQRLICSLGLACLTAAGMPCVGQTTLLVEAESFAIQGGWVVDPQFVQQMGSPYLLAHGMGQPVNDALTTMEIAEAGDYRVWVRTRDWVPSHSDDPGQFNLVVNGTVLPTVFGTESGTWHWQDGGTVALPAGTVHLALSDLTGFDGRCDAVAFIKGSALPPPVGGPALAAWRRLQRGEPSEPAAVSSADCVIVGGGLAGTCAALAAARDGLSVILIQDRPYLGGNCSREIRVRSQGTPRHTIVEAVRSTRTNTDDMSADDDRRRALVDAEPNINLFLPWRAYAAGTDAEGAITHVDARHVKTGEARRFTAPLFIDCTGDGWVGYWAGAEYRMGRESRAEHGESMAPVTADDMTMGNSLMWTTRDTGTLVSFPSAFPSMDWALQVAGTASAIGGEWNWEYGMHLNTIDDAETIRDHLLRAIYGNFYNAKQNPAYANRDFAWVPFIAGKRESRRLVGDHILVQQDIENGVFFEDAVGTGSWSIDLHEPISPDYRSRAIQVGVAPYYFPFRCLYSRNVPNLMMAGRCLSASHVGLGSPRVMNTGGQMGVAVGYAASLCTARGILPRDVYRDPNRTLDLQAKISGVWPEPPIRGEVVVDNQDTDSHYRTVGNWSTSTSDSGYYATNYQHDGNIEKGSKYAVFTPDLESDATYNIAMFWPDPSPANSSRTPVTVVDTPQVASLVPSAAVHLRNDTPNTSYGTDETLVGRVSGGVWIRTLMQFNLGLLPDNARILSARLDLTIRDKDSSSGDGWVGDEGIRVYLVTEPFEPSECTWNNRTAATAWTVPGGDVEAAALTRLDEPTDPDEVTAGEVFAFPRRSPLAAAVEDSLAGGTLGLMVRTPTIESTYPTRKLYRFASQAHADPELRPVLTVTYAVPSAPTHTLDQTSGGGDWISLGDYPLTREAGAAVIVDTGGTDGYVKVDAVRFTNTSESTADRDGDGLPDWWERWYFYSEVDAETGTDSDLDSMSNYGEYLTGTNPRDPDSVFTVRDMLDSTGQDLVLQWISASNATYRIEHSTNLEAGFTPLVTGLEATPPLNSYTVTPSQVTHFFRVQLEQ